jgi:hypothetical protein
MTIKLKSAPYLPPIEDQNQKVRLGFIIPTNLYQDYNQLQIDQFRKTGQKPTIQALVILAMTEFLENMKDK